MNPFFFISIVPHLIGAVSAIFLLVYLSPIARQIGLIDRPNDRKRHETPIPLVGGIAISISLFLALTFVPFGLSEFRYLLFCIGILLIVGVLDDHQDISASAKFGVQFIAAITIVYVDGVFVTEIGDIFNWQDGNNQGLSVFSKPLSVLAVVGVINAFNMIDGHDGLAASIGIAALLTLLIFSGLTGNWHFHYFLSIIVVIVVLFLFFNLSFLVGKKNRVFLGDAGSMILGLVTVYALIFLSSEDNGTLKSVAAPWLIGVPILDMFSVILFRIWKGVSPLRADRSHIHHLLVDMGCRKFEVLIYICLLQIVFLIIGITGNLGYIPDWILFWLMFLVFVAYVIIYKSFQKQ